MSRCGGWPGAPATVKMWDPDADGHGGCNGGGYIDVYCPGCEDCVTKNSSKKSSVKTQQLVDTIFEEVIRACEQIAFGLLANAERLSYQKQPELLQFSEKNKNMALGVKACIAEIQELKSKVLKRYK